MPLVPEYAVLPDLPSGMVLTSIYDWFGVVLPIARTNEVTNPSFELATTGYTAGAGSLARTTTFQYHGAYSAQYTPSAAVNDGFYYTLTTTVALRAISCKFLGVGNQPYALAVATTGAVELTTYTFKATGRWQWIWLYFNETSATTRRIYFRKNGSANVSPFYVDGVQSEVINNGEYVSTYIDGDQTGFVPNQVPPAYAWLGAVHASASVRSAQTRAGGMVRPLSFYGFLLSAILGLGVPTPRHVSVPYVQLDGAQYERTQLPPRQLSLVGRVNQATTQQLQQKLAPLGLVLARDYVGQQQPLALLYQLKDDCGNELSPYGRIVCSYTGGLEGQTDNRFGEQVALSFQQWLPYIQADSEFGASLSPQQSISNVKGLIQRSSTGVWSSIGTANGDVSSIVFNPVDGNTYVTGNFTSIGGTAMAGIGYWNGTSWTAMGTGLTGGLATGATLAISPTGGVVVGGSFTSAGGVANTTNLAFWNGSAWSSITGAGVPNAVVRAVAYDGAGVLYAAGDFTTINAVAANRIAKMSTGGVWTALGTGLSGSGYALAVSPQSGLIYVSGNFATANGVTVNNVALWNGTTFVALSGGLTGISNGVTGLAFTSSGLLYAGGDFTTAGGTAAACIAVWNGSLWTPLGTGITGTSPAVIAIRPTPSGLVYVGGAGWSTAGGITTPDNFAIWNGSAWALADIDLPNSPTTVETICYDPAGRLTVGYLGGAGTTATAAATQTVTNPGTLKTYPTFVIKGPSSGTSRIYGIGNLTTGKQLNFSLTLNAGETAYLYLYADTIKFVSDFQGDIMRTIIPSSAASDFSLQQGANLISTYAAAASVTFTMQARALYQGVGDLVR